MFAGSGLPDWLDGRNGSDGLGEGLEGMREALATFGGLLRCDHDEATNDHRASHARGKPAAIADEPRFAAPMFGRRIEAQRPRGRVEFGDQLVELLVARPETFVPAEAPFAAVDDAYPLTAMAAERPALDEPKAICPARALSGSGIKTTTRRS